MNPGSGDDSLLYLQSHHISQDLGKQGSLSINLVIMIFYFLLLHSCILIWKTIKFQRYRILWLWRWQPKTHTSHTTRGECTIILQDVAVQLGLTCSGKSVTSGASMDLQALRERFLGVVPLSSKLDGQILSMNWLADTFGHLLEDATDEQVACFSHAYILRLIN